jgi:hypothetical protein
MSTDHRVTSGCRPLRPVTLQLTLHRWRGRECSISPTCSVWPDKGQHQQHPSSSNSKCAAAVCASVQQLDRSSTAGQKQHSSNASNNAPQAKLARSQASTDATWALGVLCMLHHACVHGTSSVAVCFNQSVWRAFSCACHCRYLRNS